MSQTDLPGVSERNRLAVLGAVYERDRQGKTHVKAAHLADGVDLHPRAVGAALMHLEAEGYLERWGGGGSRANIYRITL